MGKWIMAILLTVSLSAAAQEMTSNEFNDFRGQYQLDGGRLLTMTSEGRRHIADIDGIGRIEVVAASDTAFVAKDGSVTLQFERWKNGNVTAVRITSSPEPAVDKKTGRFLKRSHAKD